MKARYLLIGFLISGVLIAGVSLAVFKAPEVTVYRPNAAESPENTKTVTGEALGQRYSFRYSFVEFDDDGFFADPQQAEFIKDDLAKMGESNDIITLLYLHGWNHNASYDDENVACFEQLVTSAAIMQARYGRDVYGIYVGWPGIVYANETLNTTFSYWGRETTADRISQRGDLLDLITDISKIRNRSKSRKTKFIVIGHSLGGRAAYKTLSPLMQRFIEGDIDKKLIPDLTLFVNPAFSAEEHRTLNAMMKIRANNIDALPRFVIATSEDDEVLTGVYPLARKVGSFFRGDLWLEQQARITAAGLFDDYITHELTLEGAFSNPKGTKRCPMMDAVELSISKAAYREKHSKSLYDYEDISHRDSEGNLLYRTLLKEVDAAPRSPAMIVKVKDKIIPNHNDIFTSPFVDFVSRVINCELFSACRQRYVRD